MAQAEMFLVQCSGRNCCWRGFVERYQGKMWLHRERVGIDAPKCCGGWRADRTCPACGSHGTLQPVLVYRPGGETSPEPEPGKATT